MSLHTIPKGQPVDKLGVVLGTISRLDPEKGWEIEIRELKRRRTENQNRWLWAMYADILKQGGEQLGGWSKEDLHEFFLGEHFGWETLHGLGRTRLKPRRRSSRLSKQDFTDFADSIIRKAASFGIILRDPEEYLTP